MQTIQQSAIDLQIVEIAIKLGCLPELCSLEDYDSDVGQVEPYWCPRWHIQALVKAMLK